MTLFTSETTPLDDVWVALDVETTGLDPEGDDIIEVGAVKFQGQRTLETFQSFVNPHRRLNDFVKRFTGIAQSDVDAAPPFSVVAGQLVPFVGSAPIVGHHLGFDLGFLASKGVRLSNPRTDTWDLAFVLLPELREYALARVAASLGIAHPRPHRAVPDAQTTGQLFRKLVDIASELDVYTLAQMESVASRSSWVLSYLIRALETHKLQTDGRPGVPGVIGGPPPEAPRIGASGFDVQALKERLRQGRSLRPSRAVRQVDAERVDALLREGGPLSQAMPGFEERSEQLAMARAVADAVNHGKRLMVEAGTGVGKSLAYLLPAAMYALANNKRVVVSTNTINLQEQLITKDVPTLVEALEAGETGSAQELRYCHLKGRANYLCLRRWYHLLSGDVLSDDEARLASKVLVWLQSTATGDRSELNLGNRNSSAPWTRLSSDGALECPGVSGVCFLRSARDKAAASHLVIVNHALLMSDLTAGGTLIPDYDILIVDEAHHLEEEATRHLGFELGQASIDDYLQSVAGDRGLVGQVVAAMRSSSAAASRASTVDEAALRITGSVPMVRDRAAAMFGTLARLVERDGRDARGSETRVTSATRSQPDWSNLEILWENVDASLAEMRGDLAAFSISLEGLEDAGIPNYEGLTMEVANRLQFVTDLRQRLAEFVPHPRADGIYWVSRSRRDESLVLHAAPLHVGEQLEATLFSQKETVVMTSATLSANGSFDHMRGRTGFHDCEELLLGSPFDYPRASLLCVPDDMPVPTAWAYQEAVEQAIVDATLAADGRTMALFTSHAALQATASEIRGGLQARGYDVLAQGVDGPPHRLVASFLENPKSVLLGTSSFWEGVDLAGESLKVLLVARLPFSVPTEPVFETRSEQFEDPFDEYAVPQAILRLRQGFGRLIRTKTDRGVVVILDQRIISRKYGKGFLDSLPPSTFRTCKLHELSREIKSWL